MRALLIDSYNNSLTEVDFDGTMDHLYQLLSTPNVPVTCFERVRMSNKHWVYVDESGLLKEPTNYFKIGDYPEWIAGKGIILADTPSGEDWSGAVCDIRVIAEDVQTLDTAIVGDDDGD